MNNLFVYDAVDACEISEVVLCDNHVAQRRRDGHLLEPVEAAWAADVCEDCAADGGTPT